jgi:1-acyl-sn-glycerol-3-phosphate acyltransferase
MFVNAVIAFAILFVLTALEFPLSIAYLFTERNLRHELCARYEQIGARLIFDIIKVFRGSRIRIGNPSEFQIPLHCLIISNHQSLLDIIVLIYVLGMQRKPRFVAKKELQFGLPLVSFTLRKGGHCLIKRRGAPLETMRAITKMAKNCAIEQCCPTIFPEGTRSRNGALGPFYAAGIRNILEVERLPIVAIAIDGGWRIATARDFLRRFGKESYKIEVAGIYDPPRNKTEVEKVLSDARFKINARIQKMRLL